MAHEDDAHRAVLAGIDITREVAALSAKVHDRFGFDIDVRVGIHRGLVYLDIAQDDVYGFGANLAARICSLARPGDVTVSMAIERVVRDNFELEARRRNASRASTRTSSTTAWPPNGTPPARSADRWSGGNTNWRTGKPVGTRSARAPRPPAA